MSIRTLKKFNLKNWFKIIKYSFGSRLINSVPKGIKHSYEFLLDLERKGINSKRNANFIEFQYPISSKKYTFAIEESSSDSDVFNQIILEKEYEFVKDLIIKNDIEVNTIIDAGANVGYTVIYLSCYFENAQLIALEPNKDTFIRLERNVLLNNLKNVSLYQTGLWNKKTYLKADYSFRDKQAWSFRLEETTNEEEKLFEVISVDYLLGKHGLESIDFLKIDIEGGEKELFNSEADLSWLDKVKVIAIEIHDEFECRMDIEIILKEQFTLYYSGELTIAIRTNLLK